MRRCPRSTWGYASWRKASRWREPDLARVDDSGRVWRVSMIPITYRITYRITYQGHPAPPGLQRSWSSWERGRPARFNPPVGRRPTCGCLVRFNPPVGLNTPVGLRPTCGRAARAPRGTVPRRRSRTIPGEPSPRMGVCREIPLGMGAFPGTAGVPPASTHGWAGAPRAGVPSASTSRWAFGPHAGGPPAVPGAPFREGEAVPARGAQHEPGGLP